MWSPMPGNEVPASCCFSSLSVDEISSSFTCSLFVVSSFNLGFRSTKVFDLVDTCYAFCYVSRQILLKDFLTALDGVSLF